MKKQNESIKHVNSTNIWPRCSQLHFTTAVNTMNKTLISGIAKSTSE